ncbi:MAG: carbohydrate-binding family 9-like protein [Flavobacteriaceae bacterium]|nr:MAG: carbohydrate-binding family 9-like protein [Flavobacteriaceae bacterium]
MFTKFNFLSLVVGCFSLLACAQDSGKINPETYVALQTDETILIDGEASEKSWGKVAWSNVFIDIEGVKKPTYKTQVKMMWDQQYFYILAQMEEPHVWGDITERDAVVFYNNDFEVFIDPDGDTHNYYELEINALNTVWDLFITKPYRETNVVLNDWTLTGLKSAVKIEGTLNNATDIDKGWTLEMAIPWAAYKKSYYEKNIPKDDFWRVNFSRVNWDFELIDGKYARKKDAAGKFMHEYNWVWSPTGVINMHEPEKWGYVYFSSKMVGEDATFVLPQDEKIKWELYRLMRAQKAYYTTHNNYATHIDSLDSNPIIVEHKTIYPSLETHSTGWNITVKSPFTNNTLIIKEDGKFISK